MHKIHKQFSFAYGHRVWSQTLDKEYSIDDCLACRHLHGHEGLVTVVLSAENLQRGMVIDFKYLNWFKQWVDDVVDHKFIIDINDPMFERITGRKINYVKNRRTVAGSSSSEIGYLPLIASMNPEFTEEQDIDNEITESFVVVDFVPTSENISKWFYNVIKEKMSKLDLVVDSVAFNETPKSQAVYHA